MYTFLGPEAEAAVRSGRLKPKTEFLKMYGHDAGHEV